jgi:hypothetical protein
MFITSVQLGDAMQAKCSCGWRGIPGNTFDAANTEADDHAANAHGTPNQHGTRNGSS